MIRTRTWLAIIGALLLLAGGAWLWLASGRSTGDSPGHTQAVISRDGTVLQTIDLDQVTEAQTFVIESAAGNNTILVEPGRICVRDADCRDQVCVKQGWLAQTGLPIVCLPHGLVIRLQSASPPQIDGVSQ